jgi:hypothetical protein
LALSRGRALRGAARYQEHHLLAHARQVGAQANQDLRRHTLAFTDEPQQEVLGTDVVVAQLEGLTKGELHYFFGTGRKRRRACHLDPGRPDRLLHLLAHHLESDAEKLQSPRRYAVAFAEQPQKQVLGADEVVVQQARFLLG